jgi:dihydrofolate synthase/folylpolyglutamate synthase
MLDGARSDHAGLQRQLDRLSALSPGPDILGLERVRRLLARLGDPQNDLPPVFHVAGTNGKGSVCAYLRACLEAAGHPVHVYTSPHLVRFNERMRVAGRLIDNDALADLLAETLDANRDEPLSFFEATTAAAFLAFHQVPADACIVEVGLGGRLDATNVLESPLVAGIAQLGIDHQAFLGNRIEEIAGEKAGIAKPGVPLVTQHYAAALAHRIGEVAAQKGAHWFPRGGDWDAVVYEGRVHYRDAGLKISLPLPRLTGQHQADNAALAVAMLRHQTKLELPESALRAGLGWAEWPARLQRLEPGPLAALLPDKAQLWLDGGHNPAAARALADALRVLVTDRPLIIVLGMLANKDAAGFLKPFAGRLAAIYSVPVPHHDHHSPAALAALAKANGLPGFAARDVSDALARIGRAADPARPPLVLIAGSLYLAGEVLALNEQVPD